MRALLALPIVLALTSVPVDAASSATVTLRVAPMGFVAPSHWILGNDAVWVFDPALDPSLNDAPGIAGCALTVRDTNGDGRVSGIETLNKAADVRCITGWAAQDVGFGPFVTNVDGLDAPGWPVAFWLLQHNGRLSDFGVADVSLASGHTLDFVYYLGAA